MANDRVHIDELRARRVGRSRVMFCVDMRRVAVVVRVPREIGRGERSVVHAVYCSDTACISNTTRITERASDEIADSWDSQ